MVGNEFDLDLVSDIAELSAGAEAAAQAVDGGVLIEVPGGRTRLRFVNALMQRYLYRELRPGVEPSCTGRWPSRWRSDRVGPVHR